MSLCEYDLCMLYCQLYFAQQLIYFLCSPLLLCPPPAAAASACANILLAPAPAQRVEHC